MVEPNLTRPGDGQTQAVTVVEQIEPKPAVNGDKPEFDFSDMSWAESIELGNMKALINDTIALNDEKEQARRFAAVLGKIQDMLRRTVVKLPHAWLINGAPEDIDYDKPGEVARWLRADKSRALIQAMQSSAGGADDPNA